ncbi:anaerobic ribonucleoside-triphosphate reductase [Desulfurispira natronophila]|uniref:Anaerobic ribonucleoside-triphosphate reductase n=1 Tax=Desulfurispira natronophila TaxID=682562 RepID=A0A7W8DGI1_9BACT|nr:anaerobic ribonucleoside-triphosphate reductase [Desulfurispira natronophila]MBB5021526.1 anaerobic ribonucleoside-triphosphate reductase [Desulfurispira natronophila]
MSQREAQIQQLEEQLASIKGTPCDIYSRVVGYHSPTNHWNEGKKEEFGKRETFAVNP